MFQRVMDIILSSGKWQVVLVYLKDTIIRREHYRNKTFIHNVFQSSQSSQRHVDVEESVFFKNESRYLFHAARLGWLEAENHNSDT